MFIDIHNHTLFGVDDGPQDQTVAEQMLRDAKQQGADAIILTPHYRKTMFAYPVERIEQNFAQLKELAEQIGIVISYATYLYIPFGTNTKLFVAILVGIFAYVVIGYVLEIELVRIIVSLLRAYNKKICKHKDKT